MQHLTNFIQFMTFTAVAVVYLYIIKVIRDLATPFNDDEELEENSNLAVGLRRAGLYLGFVIAVIGSVSGVGHGFWLDLKSFVVDGAVTMVLFLIGPVIANTLLLYYVRNNREIENRNVGVGFVEMGIYVATGLIINGSLTGEGGGIPSVLAFWATGQVAFIIFYWVYEWITGKSSDDSENPKGFSVKDELKNANPAAGLAVAGMMVAFGIILRASIAGPATTWAADFASFGISAAKGMLALIIIRPIVDWIFLPHTTIQVEVARDENTAAIAVTSGIYLAVAFLLAGLM